MLAHAEDVITNLSLVRDYQRRPVMARRMQVLVDDVNYFANAVAANKRDAECRANRHQVHRWGIIAAAPWLVGQLRLSAGFFIAVLNAVQTVGREAEELFEALIEAQLSISSLLKVSLAMNLETDVAQRMLANRKQRIRGRNAVMERTKPTQKSRASRCSDAGVYGERQGR